MKYLKTMTKSNNEKMVFVLSFNDIPPSANKFMGKGGNIYYKYQQEKKTWAQKILYSAINSNVAYLYLNNVNVELHYRFKDRRRRDPDNYAGKFILDGLTGAGVIVDDSFNNISLTLSSESGSNKAGFDIIITSDKSDELVELLKVKWNKRRVNDYGKN